MMRKIEEAESELMTSENTELLMATKESETYEGNNNNS